MCLDEQTNMCCCIYVCVHLCVCVVCVYMHGTSLHGYLDKCHFSIINKLV